MNAAAAASAASYQSFADATRAVLDLLAAQLPDATVALAHLDRTHEIHRIVDARDGAGLGFRSNLVVPVAESFDVHMADDTAPRRCGDVPSHAVYGRIETRRAVGARSYLGVPVELSDGARVGALSALSGTAGRFEADHEQLFGMLARVLGYELERETNERDLRRLNEALRSQARGMAAVARAARALTSDVDARGAICEAAAEAAGAPVAFLLEPRGRELVSTAMHGIDIVPVTIQPRDAQAPGAARLFSALERYFVADALDHPAVARPLVEATGARSALFEPILREDQVTGVLIVIWREPVPAPTDSVAAVLGLVTAHAAAAIEHAGLRERVEELALTDPLTGLAAERVWEEEVPRELARARRGDLPVCVGMVDIDHLAAFNMARGRQEGDRLLKESASAWSAGLREVDMLARLEGGRFGVLLPGCTLGEACDVMDRVRALTPRGQTASAGVARWDGQEPAEVLAGRAGTALDQAKAAGRDMTIPAD